MPDTSLVAACRCCCCCCWYSPSAASAVRSSSKACRLCMPPSAAHCLKQDRARGKFRSMTCCTPTLYNMIALRAFGILCSAAGLACSPPLLLVLLLPFCSWGSCCGREVEGSASAADSACVKYSAASWCFPCWWCTTPRLLRTRGLIDEAAEPPRGPPTEPSCTRPSSSLAALRLPPRNISSCERAKIPAAQEGSDARSALTSRFAAFPLRNRSASRTRYSFTSSGTFGTAGSGCPSRASNARACSIVLDAHLDTEGRANTLACPPPPGFCPLASLQLSLLMLAFATWSMPLEAAAAADRSSASCSWLLPSCCCSCKSAVSFIRPYASKISGQAFSKTVMTSAALPACLCCRYMSSSSRQVCRAAPSHMPSSCCSRGCSSRAAESSLPC
mmetsp:Transcript_30153/g.66864  ORF Transcript_30153/g.66864 Transcript_30153/m.66864 type:complete len:389 (+) Transcript_30153:1560-2726(+)